MNVFDRLAFELLPLILDHVRHEDLLACTLVNKRFHKAALPLLWREVYIKSDKALNLIITILSTTSSTPGQYVRLLHFFSYRDLTISDTHLLDIIEHVPYLEKLRLPQAHYTDTSLQQVPSYCPHLTSVVIDSDVYCQHRAITDASMVALAQHCHQLTHLDLGHMRQITDASMVALAQHCHLLTHLNLWNMDQITDASMVALAQYCHQLTHLNFYNMDQITNTSMVALGQHCHQLTHLTLSYLRNLDYATLLDHFHGCPLAYIKINPPEIKTSALQAFVESASLGLHRHHQHTLTSLTIKGYGDDILTSIYTHQLVWPHLTLFHVTFCDNLTDAIATTFIQAHPKLQVLTIKDSFYLTDQFLDNITRFLPNLLSLNVCRNDQLTGSGIWRLIKHYNGQLVGDIMCYGCEIYPRDNDFPEGLEEGFDYKLETEANAGNPDVERFYVNVFT